MDKPKSLVPENTKVVDFRQAMPGERYLISSETFNMEGVIVTATSKTVRAYPILGPYTVYDVFLEDMAIPDGYKIDGLTVHEAYRQPVLGESYITIHGYAVKGPVLVPWGDGVKRLIVVPKKRKYLVLKMEVDHSFSEAVSVDSAAVTLNKRANDKNATAYIVEE